MSFQFSGLLQDTPLADIARLFQSTRRTGCLALNPEGTQGAIYFERGEIVDSRSNQLSGMDAIRHLAQFHRGTFEFHDGAVTSNQTLAGHSTTELIEILEARMLEARQIQELMPQPHEIPHYLGGVLPSDFEVTAPELAVAMRATAGNLSMSRLADELGLDLTMVGYTVARFRAVGLMDVITPAEEPSASIQETAVLPPVSVPAPEPSAPPPTPTPGAMPSANGALPRYWRGRRIG